MNYILQYTKHALKDLKKTKNKNLHDYNKLKEDLEKLRQNPYTSANINIKSSKCPRCKRMKSGTHRIIYYIHTTKPIIEIVMIIERKKNYRDF